MNNRKEYSHLYYSILCLVLWFNFFLLTSFLYKINIIFCIYEIFYPDWPDIITATIPRENVITFQVYSFSFLLLIITVICTIFSISLITRRKRHKTIEIIRYYFINIITLTLSLIVSHIVLHRPTYTIDNIFFLGASLITLIILVTGMTLLQLLLNIKKIDDSTVIQNNGNINKTEKDVKSDSFVFFIMLISILVNLTLSVLLCLQNSKGYDYYYHEALIQNIIKGNSIILHPFYENVTNTYPPLFHLFIILISKITSINPFKVFLIRYFLPSLIGGISVYFILKEFINDRKIGYIGVMITISWLNGLSNFGGNIVFPTALSLLFLNLYLFIKAVEKQKILLLLLSSLLLSIILLTHLEVGFYGVLTLSLSAFFIKRQVTRKFFIIYLISLLLSSIPLLFFLYPLFCFIYLLPSICCGIIPHQLTNKKPNEKSSKKRKLLPLLFFFSLISIISFQIFVGFHGFGNESPLLVGINSPLSLFSIFLIPLLYIGLKKLITLENKSKQIVILFFIVPYISIIKIFMLGVLRLINPDLQLGAVGLVLFGFHSYSSIISLVGISVIITIGFNQFLNKDILKIKKIKQISLKNKKIILTVLGLMLIMNQVAFFINSSKNGNFVSEEFQNKIINLQEFFSDNRIVLSDPHTSYMIASLLGNKIIFSEHHTANNLIYNHLLERRSDLINALTCNDSVLIVDIMEKYNASVIVLWKNYPDELPLRVGTLSFDPRFDIMLSVFFEQPFEIIAINENFYVWKYEYHMH